MTNLIHVFMIVPCMICIDRVQCKQAELLEVRDREKVLRGSQGALQNQLKQLQTELSECRNELETERLELCKTATLNSTLKRKHKVGK